MKITTKTVINNWTEYTLSNDHGMSISFLDYGGIITEMITLNQSNEPENIVLRYQNYKDYEDNPHFLGAIIGRVGGRIENANFTLGEKTYNLEPNEPPHHLHGGLTGFHNTIWKTSSFQHDHSVGVTLTYTSPDGEGGYPGTVDVIVTYTLTNDNEFAIDYEAVSDMDTILTLTNHTYFNLNGQLKENVGNHTVEMNSDRILELDNELIPTGKQLDVSGTPFNFKNGRQLKDGFLTTNTQNKIAGGGYDHYFLLNQTNQPNITVHEPKSGRTMEISTDQPGVVMYTGNNLTADLEFKERSGEKHLGVCFETQAHPASLQHDGLETITLKANERYNKRTTFSFN